VKHVARHLPVATLVCGLFTATAGALLILHVIFRQLPEMEDIDSARTTARILGPHIVLLIGLMLIAAGGVYMIRQHTIKERQQSNEDR
jgi:formate hydrogenlyase subunit 3/multisubunit Na+/H+ antiporter MnhD subunit